MKTAIKIFLFTVLVTAFYDYVGQMVPQKITYPPKTIEIRAGLSSNELAALGAEIAQGKGTCLTCHTIGAAGAGRYPDLANIGKNAALRKEGFSDIDYLSESIYEPNSYIVEGFLPGMPLINKAPISLTDQEILAVIAWLQSQGGTPSVTLETKLKYAGATGPSDADKAALANASPVEKEGRALFENYACNSCHNLDKPGKLVGPSLFDIGSRMTKEEITESINNPDAVIAEGYPAGVMKATLSAMNFYENVTPLEMNKLVKFLETRKGN